MIHWITDSIGTAAYNQYEPMPENTMLDVRDLVDKAGNSPELVLHKLNIGVEALRAGKRVIVCCDYGMSRSNAVAAGLLAMWANIPFEKAVQIVLDATSEMNMRIEVLSVVQSVLHESISSVISPTSHRSILITGSSGFIGRRVTARLGAQASSHIITPPSSEINLLTDVVKLNLLVQREAVTTLVHFANPRVYTSNQALGSMLIMLKNVLDVCIQNSIRFVFMSSWEIYSGYRTQNLRANETLTPRPGSTYGQAKMLCEMLVKHYGQHYNLNYLILRSSPVYGPDSDRPKFIWNFLDKALENRDIITHIYQNGHPCLDLLYADDVENAIVAALLKNDVSGEINLGTGEIVSTTQIAEWLVQRTGSHSSITHHMIDDYVGNIAMETHLAQSQLGWRATIPWQQGLDTLVKRRLAQRGNI